MPPARASTLLAAALALAALATTAAAHGMITDPRGRGAVNCQRNVDPKVVDSSAPIDYCPMCLNMGGINAVRSAGGGSNWSPYKPMQPGGVKRGGLGICGDPAGGSDHMKWGRFGPTLSQPYVRRFTPGEAANFEFDATANHGGYLEFYLCDVSNNPGQEIRFETFGRDCHYLERVPTDSCEGGGDMECGPIDPKFPGRFVLPCGKAGGDRGDQIIGGKNGKMKYSIPNVHIEVGVIQMYWFTANSCLDPDDFMTNYNYPKVWAGCPGDGGVIGGKPVHNHYCTERGNWPEEFLNCADVSVMNDDKGSSSGNSGSQPSGGSSNGASNGGHTIASNTPEQSSVVKEDGNCVKSNNFCSFEQRCCEASQTCQDTGITGKRCIEAQKGSGGLASNGAGGVVKDGGCRKKDEQCNPTDRCCDEAQKCTYLDSAGHHKCVY